MANNIKRAATRNLTAWSTYFVIERKTNDHLQFFFDVKVLYSYKKPSEKRVAEPQSKGAVCSFGVG